MKRILAIAMIAMVAGGFLGAQSMRGLFGPAQPEAKTIEGKLAFVEEYPAVKVGTTTYLLAMPDFYYLAYTNGWKDGAAVKAEGYEIKAASDSYKPEMPRFVVSKLTVNGKEVALSDRAKAMGGFMGRGGMIGRMQDMKQGFKGRGRGW
jgi:hypothetical protein